MLSILGAEEPPGRAARAQTEAFGLAAQIRIRAFHDVAPATSKLVTDLARRGGGRSLNFYRHEHAAEVSALVCAVSSVCISSPVMASGSLMDWIVRSGLQVFGPAGFCFSACCGV